MDTLEQRLTRLQDRVAVEEATARYAHAINHGYAANPSTSTRWATSSPRARTGTQTLVNPLITTDGDAATGSWLLWIASVIGSPRAFYMNRTAAVTRAFPHRVTQTTSVHGESTN